jgi:hypothetical protein
MQKPASSQKSTAQQAKNVEQKQTWMDWLTDGYSYARQQAMLAMLSQMHVEAGRFLLYGITADNIEKNAKTLDSYVAPLRNGYKSLISTMPEIGADKINAFLASILPIQFVVAGGALYGLESFVNIKPEDKIFIVKALFPSMPLEYKLEYLKLIKDKSDNDMKMDLISAVMDVDSFEKFELKVKQEIAALATNYADQLANHKNFQVVLPFIDSRALKKSTSTKRPFLPSLSNLPSLFKGSNKDTKQPVNKK